MKQSRANRKRSKPRRSVPFLPNFITTIGLFFGFYSISYSLRGNFEVAAFLILVSGFVDALDGRVARVTNSTSLFGKEYDSLSDVVAFGVAPAIMVYLWKLDAFGRFGFLACFLFVACGALRLARFNSDTSGNLSTFTGLPIPIAAAAVTSFVLLGRVIGDVPWVMVLFGVYVLSFMMVSNIRYPSFKHIDYIKAHPFQLLVAGLLLVVVVASAPELMIFILIMTFIIGGALWDGVRYLKSKAKERKVDSEEHHETVTREDHSI